MRFRYNRFGDTMKTIEQNVICEQTINKSRFICQLIPVASLAEAKSALSAIKKEHPTATHHCYAYIIGANQSQAKFSDDGEPSNTAGSVIYGVLGKHDLSNILAVVIRYYGGIKLGAGGLVRAYSSSVALALEKAVFLPIINYVILTLTFAYSHHHSVMKLLENYEIIDKVFESDINLSVRVPKDDVELLSALLSDQSKNQIIIKQNEQ